MSKKVIFNTISKDAIDKFSSYNVALETLRQLRQNYKVKTDDINARIASMKEDRQKAIDRKDMTVDEATRTFSLEKLMSELKQAEVEYKEACKPHNESKREALKLFNDNLYLCYKLAMSKGDLGAKGNIVTKRDKQTGEVLETTKLDKSFKGYFVDFLNEIGATGQDNATAIDKFAQVMAVRASGVVRNNKEGYIKDKSKSQFKELLMLCVLDYLVEDKKVLVKNKDNTLSMNTWED